MAVDTATPRAAGLPRAAAGPAALVVLCLVPALLWLRALPLDVRFVGASTTLSSLGTLIGLVGVSSFALNLVLGARFGFVDGLFGGLDRMYRIHQVNGRVAYLLLLAHATLIVSSRATVSLQAALELFTPAAGWTIAAGVVALLAMTISISLTLWAPINHEVFVWVQRSFGFIFLLGAYHVFTTPGTKAFSRPLTFYLAALFALAVAGFARRSLFDDVLVRRFDYVVADARPLNPSVMEITMMPADERLRHRPGQFAYVTFSSEGMDDVLDPLSVVAEGPSEVITLRTGAVHNQFHPFSITSGPDEPALRVVVKAVGDYTTAMRALERGARVRVEGPYGRFSHLHVPNGRQIWIAGGIGITPFLSMARSLRDPGLEIDLYYCTKQADDALFLDELREISRSYPGLRVDHCVEDDMGFLTAAFVARRSGGLDGVDVLICGPPVMIRSLRSQLRAEGVPENRIHSELFGFVRRRLTS
jgi:predicted ferric reductase